MRKSGILMPIFSLPSRFCIGTLGAPAFSFIDFLKQAGQKLWQVLPLSPLDGYNSPYMSPCVFAGNPLFIDFDLLLKDGLLKAGDYEYFEGDCTFVDYNEAKRQSEKVLKIAFGNFKKDDDYNEFLNKNAFWLNNYAEFCGEEGFCEFKQYIFFKQWMAVKEYANKNGIEIIGDLPIYPTLNGADVAYNKEIFKLNADGSARLVSGTPPDAFSKNGQLWGGPVYDFTVQKAQNPPYKWWMQRLAQALTLYDIIRIDHFRAFEAFYEIPAGEADGKNGSWCKGPGMEFFAEAQKQLGKKLPVIAEDLGIITKDVKELLLKTGFPGMRVLQFAFDGDKNNPYLPYNFDKNTVAYIGTHDNTTVNAWQNTLNDAQKKQISAYIGNGDFNWEIIKLLMKSSADTVIFTMQDIMGLPENARINTPGTTNGNWQWRMSEGCANSWLANILKEITETYGR